MSMTKEQIALRLKWAAALESGRYGQARYHLRVRTNPITEKDGTYTYCCLGVAMEELGDYTWDQSGRNRALSINACVLLGINDEGELDATDLAELNDQGATFSTIAAKIREYTPEPTEACNCPSARSSMGWSQQHQATCKWFKEETK